MKLEKSALGMKLKTLGTVSIFSTFLLCDTFLILSLFFLKSSSIDLDSAGKESRESAQKKRGRNGGVLLCSGEKKEKRQEN